MYLTGEAAVLPQLMMWGLDWQVRLISWLDIAKTAICRLATRLSKPQVSMRSQGRGSCQWQGDRCLPLHSCHAGQIKQCASQHLALPLPAHLVPA